MRDIEGTIFPIIFTLLAFLLVAAMALAVVSAYADMKCAEAGYPNSKVTINFASYCMNLDGSVTVKMERLK